MTGGLQAILWDVDGTLAETELEGHRLAFNAAFAEHGLPWIWDRATYLPLLRVSGGRERMAAWVERSQGTPASPALLDRLVQSKKAHFASLLRRGLPLRDGVARLIGAAAAAGLPQLIVTTSSRSAVEALLSGALAPQAGAFNGCICGDDVQRKKPDPEGYRLALDRLGLEATGVLAVEDSPQGLKAAVGAGLPTLVSLSEVSRHEPLAAFEAATAVVDRLGDPGLPLTVLRGPACPSGIATLSWLERLLPTA